MINSTTQPPSSHSKYPEFLMKWNLTLGGKSTMFKQLKYWYPPKKRYSQQQQQSAGHNSVSNYNNPSQNTTTTIISTSAPSGNGNGISIVSSYAYNNNMSSTPIYASSTSSTFNTPVNSSFNNITSVLGSQSYNNNTTTLITMSSNNNSSSTTTTTNNNTSSSSYLSSSLGVSSGVGSGSMMGGGFLHTSSSYGSIQGALPPKSPRNNFSFDGHTNPTLGNIGNSVNNTSDMNSVIIFDESMKDEFREDFPTSFKNPDVRREFVSVIHRNVILAMNSLVEASINHFHYLPYDALDPMTDYLVIDSIQTINDCVSNMTPDWYLTRQVAEKVKYLWNEVPPILETFARGNELCFEHMESAQYWFNSLDRITEPNYIPTVSDILRVRVRTTGIVEAVIHVPIRIKKTTTYYYYNCENSKVRLDVERSDTDIITQANQSFDGSSISSTLFELERKKKDYTVSYTVQDKSQEQKFILDLDEVLPLQSTSLLEPIIEHKIMKDSEDSSKTLIMHKPIKVVLVSLNILIVW